MPHTWYVAFELNPRGSLRKPARSADGSAWHLAQAARFPPFEEKMRLSLHLAAV